MINANVFLKGEEEEKELQSLSSENDSWRYGH